MSDIFISYSSKDKERARELAICLQSRGWSVWWDREIPFGRSFDEVIEEHLGEAKCVIVIWSANSINSEWVKNEAREGRSKQSLIPVLVDSVKLPLEFRDIQTANLIDWKADHPNVEFDKLVCQLSTLLGTDTEASAPDPGHPPPQSTAQPKRPVAELPAAIPTARPVVKWAAAGIGSTLLSLIVAGYLAWPTLKQPSVPQLTEGTAERAIQSIAQEGYILGSSYQVDREDIAPGIVLAQRPVAGDHPPKGSPIDLYVSSSSRIEVPNVLGKAQQDARNALTERGLTVGAISTVPSDTQTVGSVINQLPQSGERIAKGNAVSLTLAGKQKVVVPDVTGQSMEAARARLKTAGLVVRLATEHLNVSDPIQPGLVLKQDPPSKSAVEEGASVTLVIAEKAEAKPQLPDVVNLSLSQATLRLKQLGLVVGRVNIAGYGPVTDTTVKSQTPQAGVAVVPGQRIDLVAIKPGIAVSGVVGLDLAAAKNALARQGITIIEVQRVTGLPSTVGKVTRQVPVAGTWVASSDSRVVLTVVDRTSLQLIHPINPH